LRSTAKSRLPVALAVTAAVFLLAARLWPADGAAAWARFAALPLLLGLALIGRRPGAELALGPGVLALLWVVVDLAGPEYRPLLYLWLAIVAGLHRWESALTTAALAVASELAAWALGAQGLGPTMAHLGFFAIFGALYAALLLREVRSVRSAREDAVKEALARVETEARDFRLIGSLLGPESKAPRDPATLAEVRRLGSVRAIREALVDVLEVARLGAGADSAFVFVLNDAGDRLKLAECVVGEGEPPLPEGYTTGPLGALGAVVRTLRPVNLQPRGGKGLGYDSTATVGAFLGVPVLRNGHVAAVLAVDRRAADPFGDREELILESVAREVDRAIESERIFAAMDQVKYEQERFYDAFSLLNQAISVDGFAGQLIEAVTRIKPVDFVAVTLYEAEAHRHQVVGVKAEATLQKSLEGHPFHDKDGGLVAMALKNGHALPYVPLSEQPDRAKLQLFGHHEGPALESVKVFPLLHRGAPLGALIVGSLRRGRELSREEERMLDTVTAHAANSLANARMYQRMEMMATTDALTGAFNRRRFGELLDECLARAARFGRQVSVLMIDADHFKSVNDTYGHPVGDLVLQRIASMLQAEARRTDVVARYGGEEFVVILDETDAAGAQRVAERIRARIEAELIQGDFGRLRVTASLGLATWPLQAQNREELLERADSALYEAKRKGRNRVAVYRDRSTVSEPPRAAM
jgi:two-component system cell cycle response regulator